MTSIRPWTRYAHKVLKFCAFGDDLKELSTCNRLQVAAVIFSRDCSSDVSIGYNGPVRGLPNDSCNGEVGRCGCVHAEANALLKLREVRSRCFMYCTHQPCLACAGMIANSGKIRAVIFKEPYRDPTGVDLLKSCGVATMHRNDIRDIVFWADVDDQLNRGVALCDITPAPDDDARLLALNEELQLLRRD